MGKLCLTVSMYSSQKIKIKMKIKLNFKTKQNRTVPIALVLNEEETNGRHRYH